MQQDPIGQQAIQEQQQNLKEMKQILGLAVIKKERKKEKQKHVFLQCQVMVRIIDDSGTCNNI